MTSDGLVYFAQLESHDCGNGLCVGYHKQNSDLKRELFEYIGPLRPQDLKL